MENICFIDFETTGVNFYTDYPIEIGAILVNDDLQIINEFHSYIRPNNAYTVSEQAYDIHGISQEKIQLSPSELSVLNDMSLKLGFNYRLASWNMSFDVAFFKMLCYRNNFDEFLNKINYRHLDIQTISYLAKKLGLIDQKINSLSDFSVFLGIKRSVKHNALEDARILIKIYKYLSNRIKGLS